MLSGDAARAGLLKHAASESDREKGVRVHKLVAPTLATDIVETLADHRKPWRGVAQQLDDLSLAKREKVLSALTPHLGKDLARWWDWSAQQPYQRGWQRRAYRSPDRADSLSARWGELRQFLGHAVQYPQPLVWHAEWALHLGQYVPLGSLFASAIALGDRQVAQVMTACIRGEHDISGPSQHACVALLSSPDPDDWADVERLLVAAQRSEGLRQSILEAADLAHPDAFARILDLVVDHRLARFAGTVRALGVWIGEDLTVGQEKQVADTAVAIRDHLRQPPRPESLVDADPVVTFLGLWSLAVETCGLRLPCRTGSSRPLYCPRPAGVSLVRVGAGALDSTGACTTATGSSSRMDGRHQLEHLCVEARRVHASMTIWPEAAGVFKLFEWFQRAEHRCRVHAGNLVRH